MKQLHTIGHSIYPIDDFVSLLKHNSIDTIVDVRSIPYSRFAPQYNKETLKHYLKKNNILYLFMGDLLGARYEDENLLFDDGRVNFQKVQQTKSFQDGVNRLDKGITQGYTIALMCSEKEAFDCHRFGLISQFLTKNGVAVNHIYPDKIVPQRDLEKELLTKYHKQLPKVNLFNLELTEDIQIQCAYTLRNRDIAYHANIKT